MHDFVLDHRWLFHLAKALTHLGDPIVLSVAAVLVAGVAFIRGARNAALVVLISRMAAVIATTALKAAVDRSRPDLVHPLAHADGSSFPSGHALGSAMFFATLALVLPRLSTWAKIAVAVVVPLLIGATRLLIGVHYPSDVLAGLAIGWLLAWAIAALFADASGAVHRLFTRHS